MIPARVPPSCISPAVRAGDVRRQHAARLVWSGWSIEAAAMLCDLPVEEVRAVAAAADSNEPVEARAP
jgi:hypothetical protein